MMRLPPCFFGFVSILALAACTPSGNQVNATASSAGHDEASTHHRNPSPRQAHQVTMTIKDAPGPFGFMRALAQYDVANRECLSPPEHNPGGHTAPVPTDDVEIPLKKVSEDQYVGTVYADQMLDQDFGSGICHWKLMQFRVHMEATGADGETLFIPSIQDDKLFASGRETVYFHKNGYPRSKMDDFPDTGLNDRSRIGPSVKDSDLFTISFYADSEVVP